MTFSTPHICRRACSNGKELRVSLSWMGYAALLVWIGGGACPFPIVWMSCSECEACHA